MGTGGDSHLFEIVGSATLAFTATPARNGDHQANVTATGASVFESGSNWRTISVDVSGAVRPAPPAVRPPVADAGDDQAAAPGDTVTLDGTGSTGTGITYSWKPDWGRRRGSRVHRSAGRRKRHRRRRPQAPESP